MEERPIEHCGMYLQQTQLLSRQAIEQAVPGIIRAGVMETFGKLLDRLLVGDTNKIVFKVGVLSEGKEWKAK